ncbi:hypothetical protein K1719_045027 [Acacia pycnantha]|nr:hypothetical protein K1719_045027 [Acacia pycnantha]
MPAGMMIPARNMTSMIGRNGNVSAFGSSSGLTLSQPNMMEGHQLLPLDMAPTPPRAMSSPHPRRRL